MSELVAVDTNVIIHLYDIGAPEQQVVAQRIIDLLRRQPVVSGAGESAVLAYPG